jgi:hypothetical protein
MLKKELVYEQVSRYRTSLKEILDTFSALKQAKTPKFGCGGVVTVRNLLHNTFIEGLASRISAVESARKGTTKTIRYP